MNDIGLIAAGSVIGAGLWWLTRPAAASDRIDGTGNQTIVEEIVSKIEEPQWRKDLRTRGAPYAALFQAAEAANGLPPGLLARLAWQESRYREDIISGRTVSPAGALGIMQIVPRWHPGVNPLDPAAAIAYAGRFLAALARQFGNWEHALKAYNWGPGNVKKWLAGQLTQPLETINYSRQILADVRAIPGNENLA